MDESLKDQLKQILGSQDENILYEPILCYKIKPKNMLGMFQANHRYLMFTNRQLYTLEPKAYQARNMIKDKIVKNRIDIEFLSHLIFLPDFQFDAYTLFDVKKV